MPPKKQINKQQIIDKAFEIVRSEGYPSLSARKLAKELNCSTQPIYQTFADMQELKIELIKKAQENMWYYIMNTCDTKLPIELACIIAYIRFARDEKKLFQMIFTSGGLDLGVMHGLDTINIKLDINMIVYANGIVMMQAFHAIELSDDKIRDMLIHAYELFKSNK